MKYVLRILLFIALFLAAAGLITGLCILGFRISEASGNVYVIASEGMQVRAANILMPDASSTGDMDKYFTDSCTENDTELKYNSYQGDRITAFDHNADIGSIWAKPWTNKATVTLTETVNTITGFHLTGEVDASGASVSVPCAPWEKRQYKLTLIKTEDGRWLIDKMEIQAVLEPDPTPTPEPPMSDVRTVPPTPTPEPTPTASPEVSP